MAKVTALPEKPILDGTEAVIIIDGGKSKRTPSSALAKSVTAEAIAARDAAAASAVLAAANANRTPRSFNGNMANPADFVAGALNAATGAVSASTTTMVSGWIPILPNTLYSAFQNSTTRATIAQYDANKGILPQPTTGSFISASTAAFARFQFLNTTAIPAFARGIIKGTDLVAYDPGTAIPDFVVSQKAARAALFDSASRLNSGLTIPARAMSDVLVRSSANLANPREFSPIGYNLQAANLQLFPQNDMFVTGFVDVTPGKYMSAQQITSAVFYGADGLPFVRLGGSPVLVPDGAVQARFSAIASAFYNNYMLVEGQVANVVYEPWDKWSFKSNVSLPNTLPFAGKTVAFLGDSITSGAYNDPSTGKLVIGYPQLITPLIGAVGFTNYANAGASYVVRTDRTDAMTQQLAKVSATHGLLLNLAGTNDGALPLGTLNSTDGSTFCGAFNNYCNEVRDKFPLMTIAFCTPIPRASNFANTQAVVDAMLTLAPRYRFPVKDLWYTSQLCPERGAVFQDHYYASGEHPNNAGFASVAPQIAKWLADIPQSM